MFLLYFIFFQIIFFNGICCLHRHGSFNDEVKEIVEVRTEDAYSMGMKSMLRWIENNMDPNKTRVFFTGMSPSHNK